jgi:anti-sigma B factor antagonist
MSQVKMKKLNGIIVLSPRGQLVGGDETTELEQKLKDLAVEGNRKLIIDLSDVEFINSWALGVLIGGHVNYSKREGHIKLASMSKRIDQLLVITKLVRIFEIYESIDEASASFADG